MLNTDKELKLDYSISEVARMFDVNESLRNTPGLPPGERAGDDTGGRPAKAEREPGDNDTPRRDRKQVETDQGRIARHEGSIRSVGSFQIALTP